MNKISQRNEIEPKWSQCRRVSRYELTFVPMILSKEKKDPSIYSFYA